MEYVIEAKGFNVVISEDTDNQILIECGDGYQQDLMDDYFWSEHQADSVDEVFAEALNSKGFDVDVHWEDRELFIIETDHPAAEGLTMKIVAEAIQNVIPGSTIKEEAK